MAATSTTPTLEGRWSVFVCTGCGECTGRHNQCEAERRKTPVVPVDQEAQAAAVLALEALLVQRGERATLNEMVQAVLTGAATSRAA